MSEFMKNREVEPDIFNTLLGASALVHVRMTPELYNAGIQDEDLFYEMIPKDEQNPWFIARISERPSEDEQVVSLTLGKSGNFNLWKGAKIVAAFSPKELEYFHNIEIL